MGALTADLYMQTICNPVSSNIHQIKHEFNFMDLRVEIGRETHNVNFCIETGIIRVSLVRFHFGLHRKKMYLMRSMF